MEQELSDFQIALKGQLTVNLPIIFVMIAGFMFSTIFIDNRRICMLVGLIFGWICWRFLAPIWVKWAYEKGISKERISSIGKKALLIWGKAYVLEVIEQDKKPWM